MTPAILMAMQATVEAIPEDAPAQATALADGASSGAAAASANLDLLRLVLDASLPVQLIMLLLVAGSLVSWVIIFRKRSVIARAHKEAERFEERFWSGAELTKLYAGATQGRGPIGGMEAIFEAGFREFGRLRQRKGVDTRTQLEGAQRAMRATGSREIDGLEHNLELLANIGSTAPYVGLVGTVFGIMVTMHGLLASGAQVGIKDVAPGISEALLATAIGLFVAIPAVWAYNRFANGVERLAVRYDAFAEEFSSILQRQAHADE
ncbi:protein TolQ [Lysobacter solisilvae (ex Woo and Kim 2020)]|uniref:Tol-Pal system protein TolQ n=1 Tax=Agrilutibacter terrestris TaxID=2865112 RepID=A0A7H0FZ24_9GAMM|nr:protein TolQ [Lysobacter terrestris]QNP41290.1 protein TolQ [Lysobacter terrestris]